LIVQVLKKAYIRFFKFLILLPTGLQCYQCIALQTQHIPEVLHAVEEKLKGYTSVYTKSGYLEYTAVPCPFYTPPSDYSAIWSLISRKCRDGSVCIQAEISVASTLNGTKTGPFSPKVESTVDSFTSGVIFGCAPKTFFTNRQGSGGIISGQTFPGYPNDDIDSRTFGKEFVVEPSNWDKMTFNISRIFQHKVTIVPSISSYCGGENCNPSMSPFQHSQLLLAPFLLLFWSNCLVLYHFQL